MEIIIKMNAEVGIEMASQNKVLSKISEKQQEIANDWVEYWKDYSDFSTWQFWFHVAMFIVPLIVLYINLDRRKAFHLGFFGFNIHVWFTYFDAFGTRQGLWTYPYQMVPFLPNSIGMDASLVPVAFMLVYQWTINNNKNYYLYTLILSVFLTFALKPIFVIWNLFQFVAIVNYLHLFLSYIVVIVLSKLITDLFLHFQKESNPQ
jgi:hypothetical protein